MDSTSQRSSDERPSSELTSEERERLDGRAEQARQDDAVEESADIQLSRAFHRSLISGEERLHRSLPNMSATGV